MLCGRVYSECEDMELCEERDQAALDAPEPTREQVRRRERIEKSIKGGL